MPKAGKKAPRAAAVSVREWIRRLDRAHGAAKLALEYSSPLELLAALILAAQCTDERVNEVTGAQFRKYRKAEDYANADQEELEKEIRSTGFYHNKAKAIRSCCSQIIVRQMTI